ncbi:MAG: DUF2441 domain-containing protein, partial [Prevotellaceae bacterium]|nr:DUF2441 domain-containing protein [Prevotellaceae bacterium]
MELVKDKTFYHIQKEPSWKVGETHFAGLNKNYYLDFFDENGHNFEDPVTKKIMHPNKVAEFLIEYLQTGHKDEDIINDYSYNTIFTLRVLNDIIWNYSRYILELLYEEIRRDFFPSYPSRTRGIWVMSDKNDIPYWIKTLGANKDSSIFEVVLTGKIHEANHWDIRLTTNSFNGIRKQAFNYWMTDKVTKSEIGNECIFEGFVFVKRIIPLEELLNDSLQKANGQCEISSNILRNFSDLQKWMKLQLSKKLFSSDMLYSSHGIAHTSRVLFGTVLLTHYIQGISEDIKRAVYYSAIIHDLGRTNDYKDNTHGANSAELYRSQIEQFVPDKDLQAQVLSAVKYHSLDDSLCPQEEQSIIWKIYRDKLPVVGIAGPNKHLFVKADGTPISIHTVYCNFRKII